jgi:hypothetical protein
MQCLMDCSVMYVTGKSLATLLWPNHVVTCHDRSSVPNVDKRMWLPSVAHVLLLCMQADVAGLYRFHQGMASDQQCGEDDYRIRTFWACGRCVG